MSLYPFPFPQVLSHSTLLRPFACHNRPTLRFASYGSARPLAGSAANRQQPPAATTLELALTSPDHQSPRPRSPRRRRSTSGRRNPGARADVARPPAAVTSEPTSTSPDLRPPRPRVHLPAVQDQQSPTPPLRLLLAPASHRPPRRTRLDPDPAITRLSFLLSWASSSSPAIARPQHRARAPKTDITTEVNHLFHFLIPLCI
jgi:hypothetical protein